jgi:hypothetical protein
MKAGSVLERAVLGSLRLRADLLEASDVRADDFSSGQFRETFEAISALWEETRHPEIDLAILISRLGGDGSGEFIGSLMSGDLKLEPAAFQDQVDELRKSRILSRIQSQAKADQINVESLRSELEAYDALGESAAEFKDFLKTGAELQALDINVEYAIDQLIPARSLTLLHSRGGLGKTWLCLGLAKAIRAGEPFLGLSTKSRPVYYIDFENPLPLLVERVRKLDIRDVSFWHLSAEPRPPKLDGPDWTLYKKLLAPASLVIFDTLRAAHNGDENSSQDAAIIMGRLKEIREFGHDIIALHHTGKASDRIYKGSTAFSDLADHVLDFHRVRRGTLEEIDEDDQDPDALFSLGTGDKTRFAPIRLYLTFDAASGTFSRAQDPKDEKIDRIAEFIAGAGAGLNQSQIVAWAKGELDIKKRDSILALLKRGEIADRWHSHIGFQGARIYEPK